MDGTFTIGKDESELLAAVAGLDKSVSALVDLSWVEVCDSQRVFRPLTEESLSAEPKT